MRSLFRRVKELYSEGKLLDKLLHSGPLQMEPRKRTHQYSYTHLTKGSSYHQAFSKYPGRKMIWELEQETLNIIVYELGSIKTHLDFAGGTGRIAGVIEDYCDEQYILDISPEMLKVASENLSKAKIICADFTDNPSELGQKKFDLITAFRFFPNAEPVLREAAMEFISNKLNEGGILICNNHRNFWSIPYFVQRLTYSGGSTGMSNNEMITLANQHGLKFTQVYSMGVIPQTEKKAMLPWKAIKIIERFIFSLLGNKHQRGYAVIYVFEKNTSNSGL